jgi:hypothetical protein
MSRKLDNAAPLVRTYRKPVLVKGAVLTAVAAANNISAIER